MVLFETKPDVDSFVWRVCVYFQTVRLPNPTWTLAGKQRVTSRKSPAKCQSAPSQGTDI